MKKLDAFAMILVIIGALNWGFLALFNFDLFSFFAESNTASRFVCAIVGFAGLFKVVYWVTGNWKTSFEEK